MSSRVFQSVIVQMKEATDRVIGVIDADSNVISCSDTSLIGEKWPEAVIKLNSAPDSVVVVDKKTFKPLARVVFFGSITVGFILHAPIRSSDKSSAGPRCGDRSYSDPLFSLQFHSLSRRTRMRSISP